MTTTLTIPTNTTAKLIGLAATGAAMLGMNLSDALLLDPAELTALIRHLTGSGEATGAAAATPAAPATQPEQPTTTLPTGMGLTARVAWLEGQHNTTNNNKH